MNRTEYSLSLDAVICRRCNTVSRADEDTCPSCGADRQGAIFTSAADAAATAAAAAATMPEPEPEQLDFVDLRDTGWLKRVVRRKMVTSYPSLAEPGDEPEAPARKPPRTGLAVLVGGVVAGLAAGGYWYVHSDDDPAKARPVISAAGAIHDGASDANDARRAALTRAKPESTSTQAQAAAPASSTMAKASRAHETQPSEAPRAVAQASGAKNVARNPASEPAAQVAVAARPAAPGASIAPPTPSRAEPSVSMPARTAAAGGATMATATATATSGSTLAATAPATPAKPPMQATPPAVIAANAASHVAAPPAAQPVKPSVATGAIASMSNQTVPTTPPVKPVTQPTATAIAVATSATKPEPHDSTSKPAAPKVAAAAVQPSPTQPAPHPTTTLAATPTPPAAKPAAPITRAPEPARSTTTAIASNAPAAAPQRAATKDKQEKQDKPAVAPTIASAEKPATPPAHPVQEPPSPSVARNIAAVQQALASRDLTSARRHMRGLSASQPRSPEIQQLAADLSRQERARDGAIAGARTCASNKEPNCAIRNARRAVSLDPRNAQAQAALHQALALQNEANTEYFRQASGIPRPTVPAMTFDGRWTASARHSAAPVDQVDAAQFAPIGWGVPAVSKGRGDAH